MSQILIREGAVQDSPIIADFQVNMALETENFELDKNTVLNGIRAVINENDKGSYYVAEDKGKVVACVMVTKEWSDWRNGWVWWLQSVYVRPEYRNQGVFSMLYDFIKDMALSSPKVMGLRLYVDKTNLNAQKVYDALGMTGEHYMTYEWMK